MPPDCRNNPCFFLQIIRLLTIALLFFQTVMGQYRIDQWTADNGLPQNSVYSIIQTRDGYLWFATLDGLVRFDGVKFTVFNKSNSSGIINNRFTSLFEASIDDLWAGTEESGFVRYRNGRFTSYGVESGLSNLNTTNLLNSINIWGDENGNPIFQLGNFEFYRFIGDRFLSMNGENVPSPSVANVSPQNTFIYCSIDLNKKELSCLVKGQWELFSFPKGLQNLSISAAVHDTNGATWILTSEGKLFHFDKTKTAKTYDKLSGTPLLLIPGTNFYSLSKDKEGVFWVTNLKTGNEERLTQSPPAAFINIHTAYEDREGNFWFGTIRNGLFRVRKQLITTYSKPEEIADNNVYPIFEDRHGTIWIGTTSGLSKYQNGTFTLIKSAEGFSITTLGEDDSGRLLINTQGDLFLLENDKLKLIYRNQTGVNWAVYTDSDKAIWIGSQNGLLRFKDNLTTIFTTQEGLAGNNVKVIIKDKNGGFWIGSYGGLSHYKDGKLNKWIETADLTIRSLHQDNDGVLWIGTYDSGLARFKDGKFTFYTSKNGLYNDGAFQILEDERKNFWINSNRGIYRVSKDELNEFAEGQRRSINSVAYGKSDGLLNVEGNGGRSPGGIKARDGRLWFPTQGGVAVINPATIRINQKPPPAIIEDVKIDNQSVSVETIYEALGNPQTAIRIEPNQQNFEIQYTALSFINSENLRFKYKLEELDNDWIDAGTRRTAYFSHVPPGEYTFRVIAANSDGVWNEESKSLKIVVLPPFYRTWQFIVLSVLGIAAVAYFLFKRRIAQIERGRLAQQNFARQLIASQEQERKRIAAELHDSLGQRLVVIKNLAWMFLSAKDKTDKSQIEEISAEASEAIGEVKEISYNLRPYQLDRIGLTKAIEAIVRSAQAASAIDFSAKIDNIDDYFPKEAEINFYRIVQESVNNIIKHSRAAQAKIEIARNERHLEVTIADNGRGFGAESDSSKPKSGGFGLIGITERVELLGGRVELKSAPKEGTIINIWIKNEQ